MFAPARLTPARQHRIAHAIGLGKEGKKLGTYCFTGREQEIIGAALQQYKVFIHRTSSQAWRDRRKLDGDAHETNDEGNGTNRDDSGDSDEDEGSVEQAAD